MSILCADVWRKAVAQLDMDLGVWVEYMSLIVWCSPKKKRATGCHFQIIIIIIIHSLVLPVALSIIRNDLKKKKKTQIYSRFASRSASSLASVRMRESCSHWRLLKHVLVVRWDSRFVVSLNDLQVFHGLSQSNSWIAFVLVLGIEVTIPISTSGHHAPFHNNVQGVMLWCISSFINLTYFFSETLVLQISTYHIRREE